VGEFFNTHRDSHHLSQNATILRIDRTSKESRPRRGDGNCAPATTVTALRFPQVCVVLRIYGRPNPRYRCPLLYDHEHDTIGGRVAGTGSERSGLRPFLYLLEFCFLPCFQPLDWFSDFSNVSIRNSLALRRRDPVLGKRAARYSRGAVRDLVPSADASQPAALFAPAHENGDEKSRSVRDWEISDPSSAPLSQHATRAELRVVVSPQSNPVRPVDRTGLSRKTFQNPCEQ